MITRYFFILFIISFFCNCSNKKEASTISLKDQSVELGDTIPLLKQLLMDYRNAIKKLDSSVIKNSFNQLYDAIDSLSYIKTTNDYNQLAVYCSLSKKSIDSSAEKGRVKELLVKQKVNWLEYLIFLFYNSNENELLIEAFNELNTEENKKYISADNFLLRLIDAGVAYHKIGDEQQTERIYKEANLLAKKLDYQIMVAKTTLNINKFLFQKELFDSVIILSQSVIEKDIPKNLQAWLASDIATAFYKKKDIDQYKYYSKAEYQLLSSIKKEDQADDYYLQLYNAYINKARTSEESMPIKDSCYNTALRFLEKQFGGIGRETAKLYVEMANHKFANPSSQLPFTIMQYYNKALAALLPKESKSIDSFYIPSQTQLYSENTFIDICDAKADYLLKSINTPNETQLQKILSLYEASFLVEKKLIFNFVHENAKINYLNTNRIRTMTCLDICYQLYQKNKNKSWIEKGLQYLENNKAYVLIESIQKNNYLNEKLLNDIDFAEYKKLKKQLGKIDENHTSQLMINRDSAIGVLVDKIESIETSIANKHPQFRQIQKNILPQLTIGKITNDFIDKKTASINYFYDDTILYSISLSKEQNTFQKTHLPLDLVNNYKNASQNILFQLNNPDSFINLSNTLYQKLLIQNTIGKGIENLIISPDANLFNVSFASLITQKKNNNSYKSQNYLIKEHSINYVFSLSSLYFNRKTTDTDFKILATAPFCNTSINNKPLLTNSKNELDEIGKQFPSAKLLFDKEAKRSNFTNLTQQYNILHVASHSNYDSLSGTSYIDFFDSSLSSYHFYSDPTFQVNLFFLSACETNIGKQAGGEGVLSLARSVYYAGAQNVISTNWQINDKATSKIVSSFYKNIALGFSSSLQKAQKEYIQTSDASKSAPYYWASYNLIGIPKIPKSNTKTYIFIAGIVFSSILLWLYFKRGNRKRKNTK